MKEKIKRHKKNITIVLVLIASIIIYFSLAKNTNVIKLNANQKDATRITKRINEKISAELRFKDEREKALAQKGLIYASENLKIHDNNGKTVLDMGSYDFLNKKAPNTVNHNLWTQSQLNMNYGLFEVKEGIYQVRGYDISNMSFIATDNGWVVVDPLASTETAKAAMELVDSQLGKRPIKAVIYTHSHADHFSGIKGIITEAEIKYKGIKIIASEGFAEEAVSDNVMVGNVMNRRLIYEGGLSLEKGEKGHIDTEAGKLNSTGHTSLILPTNTIRETGEKMTIDGLEIVFQNIPEGGAPAGIMFYFPKYKALCLAEECSSTFMNLYSLRGSKTRDINAWAHYINEAIDMFGKDVEVSFGSHHWPRWGGGEVVSYMEKQRDIYKYIHDQTLHFANKGYTPEEIAEIIVIPDSFKTKWHTNNKYGTILKYDIKSVYENYLGVFNGNPSYLNHLPEKQVAKKYVEFMGGEKKVMKQASKSYKKGEYRWVAEVVGHVVFANPKNMKARYLQADALEQLGYQAESAIWRNFYLTGAMELRNGINSTIVKQTINKDVMNAMDTSMILDYLAIKLNAERADGKDIEINFEFKDTNEKYCIIVKNSILSHKKGDCKKANIIATTTRQTFNDIHLGRIIVESAIKNGDINVDGSKKQFSEFLNLFDEFDLWFNIVMP